eukprot:394363-Prorocentrum_minimum.AAC.1
MPLVQSAAADARCQGNRTDMREGRIHTREGRIHGFTRVRGGFTPVARNAAGGREAAAAILVGHSTWSPPTL